LADIFTDGLNKNQNITVAASSHVWVYDNKTWNLCVSTSWIYI